VNTPLQSLELGISLLETRHPDEKPTLDRLNRALQVLKDVSLRLSGAHGGGVRSFIESGASLDRFE
jgi:hypothetical protein